MAFQNKTLTIGLLIICLPIVILQEPAHAASVYAIPNHSVDTLKVYDILEGGQEGKLEYRATYDLEYGQPADVTIDTRSHFLFVTFEFEDDIELVNARTFLSEGVITADGASDLAGVLIHHVDPNTTLLYTVDRGKNKLFVYDWDAEAKELTLMPYSPTQPYYTLLC